MDNENLQQRVEQLEKNVVQLATHLSTMYGQTEACIHAIAGILEGIQSPEQVKTCVSRNLELAIACNLAESINPISADELDRIVTRFNVANA